MTAHSLGRKPKDVLAHIPRSREAATAIRATSICCRRFAANSSFFAPFLGLTPKATCWRHYVAEDAQLQNLRFGLVSNAKVTLFPEFRARPPNGQCQVPRRRIADLVSRPCRQDVIRSAIADATGLLSG